MKLKASLRAAINSLRKGRLPRRNREVFPEAPATFAPLAANCHHNYIRTEATKVPSTTELVARLAVRSSAGPAEKHMRQLIDRTHDQQDLQVICQQLLSIQGCLPFEARRRFGLCQHVLRQKAFTGSRATTEGLQRLLLLVMKTWRPNLEAELSLHDFVRRTVFHIGRAAPTSGQEEAETWICDLLLGPFLEAASRAQDGKARVLYTLVSQGLQTSREYTELDVTNVHKTCLSSLLSLPGGVVLEGFSLLRECLEWTVCDLTAEECTVLLERCLQGLRHSERLESARQLRQAAADTIKIAARIAKLLLEDPETKVVPQLATAIESAYSKLCKLLQQHRGARQGRAGIQAADEVLSALKDLHEAEQKHSPRLATSTRAAYVLEDEETQFEEVRARHPRYAVQGRDTLDKAAASPEPSSSTDLPQAELPPAQEESKAAASTSQASMEDSKSEEAPSKVAVLTKSKNAKEQGKSPSHGRKKSQPRTPSADVKQETGSQAAEVARQAEEAQPETPKLQDKSPPSAVRPAEGEDQETQSAPQSIAQRIVAEQQANLAAVHEAMLKEQGLSSRPASSSSSRAMPVHKEEEQALPEWQYDRFREAGRIHHVGFSPLRQGMNMWTAGQMCKVH